MLSDPTDNESEPLPLKQGSFIVAPTQLGSSKPVIGFTVKAELLNKSNEVVQTQSFDASSQQLQKLNLNLGAGLWRLSIAHDVYKTFTDIYELEDRQTIDIRPELELKPYSLQTTIVDSQTGEAISFAKVKVYDIQSNQVIFEGATDQKGSIDTPKQLNASNIKVVIESANHLSSTRYVSRNIIKSKDVNLGTIRLRLLNTENLLPDLVITNLHLDEVKTNTASLIVNGSAKVTVHNLSDTQLDAQNLKITLFVDKNQNQIIDESEIVLGEVSRNYLFTANGTSEFVIPVAGLTSFLEAPITAIVDSDKRIAESDENNNIIESYKLTKIKYNEDNSSDKVGTLKPEVVWHYGASDTNPYGSEESGFNNTPPVVAPVFDTNEDGAIGTGDKSSVFYITQQGQLIALDGADGSAHWTRQGYEMNYYYPTLSIADLNGDGAVELVVGKTNAELDILNAQTGDLIKTISVPNGIISNDAQIADVNGDGKADLVTNSGYYDLSREVWVPFNSPFIKSFYPVVVADLRSDNEGMEIVSGRSVFDSQGKLMFGLQGVTSSRRYISSAAIADLDNDQIPEIITTSGGYLNINSSQNGALINRYRINCANEAPVPTIADYNNDGKVDIGVAGECAYSVFNSDGSVVWSIPTNDASSQLTGSTVFDLDNDGKNEVLYADESEFVVLDGTDGSRIFSVPHTSATWIEYPVVADVDADGHADIILGSYGYGKSYDGNTYNGIRMISSQNKDWAKTRNIWNQFSYHITNINDDMSVPNTENSSWTTHNTYRINKKITQEKSQIFAKDATVSYLRIQDNGRFDDTKFIARIGNAGGGLLPKGMPISFYRIPKGESQANAQLIRTTTLNTALDSGEYADISIDYYLGNGGLAGFGDIVVVANDAGAGLESATGIPSTNNPNNDLSKNVVSEFTRTNNIDSITVSSGFNRFTLDASIDKDFYTSNDIVELNAIPTNLGSFPSTPTVRVAIIDSVGNVVAQFDDKQVDLGVSLLNNGGNAVNSETIKHTWNTKQYRSGNYVARFELIYKDKVVAKATRPFAIVSDASDGVQTQSELFVDKTQYLPTDSVQIHSRILNDASNQVAGGRKAILTVKDPDGKRIWEQVYGYDDLAPNAIRDQYFTLPLSEAVSGQYTVTSEVVATDNSQSAQIITKTFEVQSASETGFGIIGTLNAPQVAEIGVSTPLTWSLLNDGSNTANTLQPAIFLYRNDETEPFDKFVITPQSLDSMQSNDGVIEWMPEGEEGDTITAVLVLESESGNTTLSLNQMVLEEAKLGSGIVGQITAPAQMEIGIENILDWSLTNQSANQVSNLPVEVLLFREDASTPFDRITIDPISFDANSTIENNSAWIPKGEDGEIITAVLLLNTDQGENILSSTKFELIKAALGSGIQGSLTAPANVKVGDEVSLDWSLDNQRFNDITNVPLNITFYDSGTNQPLDSIDFESGKIDATADKEGSIKWTATGPINGKVTAVLSIREPSNKVLGDAVIQLLEPAIQVTINDPAQLADTLLVYYSCAPGWHTYVQNFSLGLFENECFDQRATVLSRYLDRIDVPYKLVKRPEQFAHEMQSGKYAQYWLLGAIEQLRPHTQRELTELAYSGDNLLMDSGMHSWQNQGLYELAGATHKGRVLLNMDMLALSDTYIQPNDDGIINSTPLPIVNRNDSGNPYHSDWVQWLEPLDDSNTQVWATMNGQRKRITNLAQRNEADKDFAAITSQKYGNGMPIATAFDVIASLDMATTANLPPYPDANSRTNAQELRWDTLLTQWLTSREQSPQSDYVPNEVVRVPLSVTNPSRSNKRILVSVDLPDESQWLGYEGGITDKNSSTALPTDKNPVQNPISYQITLAAGQSLQDVLTLRLPKQAGTHAVRITVSDITQGSKNSVELEQYEARYLVRDINARLALIESTLNNWDVWTDNGFYKLHSKTQLGLIKTHRATGARQLAVYEAANLATTLATLQKTDDSDTLRQLRYEVDDLLKALQIDWYIERDGYIPPS